jgi:valyl-tRNA synthetase
MLVLFDDVPVFKQAGWDDLKSTGFNSVAEAKILDRRLSIHVRPTQTYIEQNKTFRVTDDTSRRKLYVLDMFPYPSGAGLHVGHPEGYTASDILARYFRMRGYNVLHPMGWDAFGLPAENYAIKSGRHPAATTAENIARMKKQIKSLGFAYDWSREINTTDPEYYKWTQWFFLKLYDAGLAYRAKAPVNWCPRCLTALSDLEVIQAEEKGTLTYIAYPLEDKSGEIVVATTRPETLLGDTAVAVHPDDNRYTHLKGKSVLLPILGRPIPIIAEPQVDPEFGTGAVKITPGHDFKDFEIARIHSLPAINIFPFLPAS